MGVGWCVGVLNYGCVNVSVVLRCMCGFGCVSVFVQGVEAFVWRRCRSGSAGVKM